MVALGGEHLKVQALPIVKHDKGPVQVARTGCEEVRTVRRESSIVTTAAEALRKHVTGIMQSVNRAISRAGTYERKGQISVGSQLDFCVDLTS